MYYIHPGDQTSSILVKRIVCIIFKFLRYVKEDRILIKILRVEKEYGVMGKVSFSPRKNCSIISINRLIQLGLLTMTLIISNSDRIMRMEDTFNIKFKCSV